MQNSKRKNNGKRGRDKRCSPKTAARTMLGNMGKRFCRSRAFDFRKTRRRQGDALFKPSFHEIFDITVFVHFDSPNISFNFSVAVRIHVSAVPSGTPSSDAISLKESSPSIRISNT